ncbi:MAG: hypothetical protein U1F50_10070 [Rubrivivax sp.]
MLTKSLLPLALVAACGAALAADAPKTQMPHKTLPQAAGATHAGAQAVAHTMPAVRDWNQVDANGDHLVSPEEMEKYLAANPGPLKPKS